MSTKNSLISNFKALWFIMNKEEKFKSFLFVFFTFIQVFLETISIGSLYPLMLGVFNNGNQPLNFLDNEFLKINFDNFIFNENFILSISVIILIIFLLKNFFLIFLVHWSQSFERDVKVRLKSIY